MLLYSANHLTAYPAPLCNDQSQRDWNTCICTYIYIYTYTYYIYIYVLYIYMCVDIRHWLYDKRYVSMIWQDNHRDCWFAAWHMTFLNVWNGRVPSRSQHLTHSLAIYCCTRRLSSMHWSYTRLQELSGSRAKRLHLTVPNRPLNLNWSLTNGWLCFKRSFVHVNYGLNWIELD